MGVCMGVTLVLMVLRIYVKVAVNHLWDWDDCESFKGNGHLYIANCRRGLPDGIREKLVHLSDLSRSNGCANRHLWSPMLSYPLPVSLETAFLRPSRHTLAYIIPVMGPGGGIGTHIWDIRVTRFTKGYLQVCDSELARRSA